MADRAGKQRHGNRFCINIDMSKSAIGEIIKWIHSRKFVPMHLDRGPNGQKAMMIASRSGWVLRGGEKMENPLHGDSRFPSATEHLYTHVFKIYNNKMRDTMTIVIGKVQSFYTSTVKGTTTAPIEIYRDVVSYPNLRQFESAWGVWNRETRKARSQNDTFSPDL